MFLVEEEITLARGFSLEHATALGNIRGIYMKKSQRAAYILLSSTILLHKNVCARKTKVG